MERISYLIFITIIVCETNNQSNIFVNSSFALNKSHQVTLSRTENVIIDAHVNDASNITYELMQIFNDDPINESTVSTNEETQDDCIGPGTKNGQPELFSNYFPEDDAKIADYICFSGEKGSVKLYQKDPYSPKTMINFKKTATQPTTSTIQPTTSTIQTPIFMDKQVKCLISG